MMAQRAYKQFGVLSQATIHLDKFKVSSEYQFQEASAIGCIQEGQVKGTDKKERITDQVTAVVMTASSMTEVDLQAITELEIHP